MKVLKFFKSEPYFDKDEPLGFWEDFFFSHRLEYDTNQIRRENLRVEAVYTSLLVVALVTLIISVWL